MSSLSLAADVVQIDLVPLAQLASNCMLLNRGALPVSVYSTHCKESLGVAGAP